MKPLAPTTAWLLLCVAAVLDVLWAISLKYAQGPHRIAWSAVSLVLLAGFVWALGRSLSVLPVGVAYAVWTGLGAIGAFAAGVVLFGEASSPVRIGGIALVLAGIALLKLGPA